MVSVSPVGDARQFRHLEYWPPGVHFDAGIPMLSGRFRDAIADRKSGGERSWTVSLWMVIAVVGAVVVVPALIALGTEAWIAKPDVRASEVAPEIESANANDRHSVGGAPTQTTSHRSAN